jgi:exosortase H (IPTLxxWG-CTERM-specific)
MADQETRARGSQPPAGAASAQNLRARMRRFLIVFPICLAAGFALLLAPFSASAVTAFTSGVVFLCAKLVWLCGGQAAAVQNVLRNPVTGFSIRVEDTCNASNVTILLWAAVLAFPAQWRERAKGLAAGTLAIHGVNLFRIVSLFYLGQHSPAMFEFAHLYVWEGVIMLVTLVVFWTWVQRTYRAGQSPAP